MKVNFRLHDQPNSVQTVYVPSCNTLVQHVRVLVAEGVDAKPEQLRLIYAGKQLHDTQTLFQCSFRDADTILVMLRNIPALPQPNTLDKVSSNDSETASTFSTSSKSVEAENQIDAEKNSEDTEEEQTYFCDICKNNDKKKCLNCGCNICGGKEDEERTLACDECQMYFHMDCMKPVLKEIPEGDWYCHNCVNDSSDIVVPGQEPVISKKKAKMPSATQKKDWGRGKACVGLSKKCTVVDPEHVGPIPGIPVGSSWKFRINVAEAGVHRPPVAGIAGKASTGAVSIVLAAGYPEDKDEGLEFTYTGAGGRNLKDGNKRIGQQTRDQVLEGVNEALARTCDCPISLKGGVAKNWKNSRGIRVIRSVKLRKHNVEYAPLEGNRYDGIYKIVKYWPERGESGYDVWRYLMRRDDPEPAPWTEAGKKRIKALGLVMYDPDATPVIAKDRTYNIPERILNLMKADSANDRSWRAVQQKKYTTFADLLEVVFEDIFSCPICKDKVVSPVTSSCGHNTCQSCLSDAFKNMGKQCPTCRADLCKDSVKINKNLEAVFTELMSQGPAVDVETAEAPSSSKTEDSSNLIPSNVKSSKVGSSKVKPQKVKPSKENVPKVNPSKENVPKMISSKVNSSIVNSSKENIPQVVESLSIGTGKKRSAPSSTPDSTSSRKSARFTRTS